MSLAITFLGHAGFLLSDGTHTLALDPFLTGNPVAERAASDVRCNYVALTHGHVDHIGDAAAIANANNAKVIANFELANYLAEQGCAIDPGNPGGKIETPFGYVAFTQAFHSSSHEGVYLGQPNGLVVNMGGVTFYHTGDTSLFSDMKLIGDIYQPHVAAICAGDRFTMGPELATRAAEFIGAKTAIPIHWGTWPILAQSMEAFAPEGVEVKMMSAGDTWECDG
jgi:L-ascorbate metabolism protein UlaG (beta-lactamase superfamily)